MTGSFMGEELSQAAGEDYPIDLTTALELSGVRSPEILIAQQRTLVQAARQQLAAAQVLPTLNVGANRDMHIGALQQASGNILSIKRDAFYIGAGGNAVAAGSVGIPGLVYDLNPSTAIYGFLSQRQIAAASRFSAQATRNQVLLSVTLAYADLLRAEAHRSNAEQSRKETAEIARLTAAFARAGEGRQADANRAATELSRREGELLAAEAELTTASARLAGLLSLEVSFRLRPTDTWLIPKPITPDVIPLPELLAIALSQRPELAEQRAVIGAAMYQLDSAKMLPFSPQIFAGYSGGFFGGGSDLVQSADNPRFGAPTDQPRFGGLHAREDIDVVAYWSLRNLGVGNRALVDASRSRWRQSDLILMARLNQVRQEVADAYVRTHTQFASLEDRAQAVRSSQLAASQDLIRAKNQEGHPIELLDSLRLLRDSRRNYIDTIVDYNRAHYQLYVALGNPPADLLTRPVPPAEAKP